MNKPKLLDLFSGAGGCTRGYQQAGFYVVGVDIKEQPRYVGDEFICADVMEWFPAAIASGYVEQFDVIHASPPCQYHSVTAALPNVDKNSHVDLVAPIRKLLQITYKPYVIENVEGAPLVNPLMLCGTMFPGLLTIRHRLFETCPTIWFPPAQCCHWGKTIPVMAGDKREAGIVPGLDTHLEGFGFDFVTVSGAQGLKGDYERAMKIDWMTQYELTQAIPPAYCEYIGRKMLGMIGVTV